MTTRRGAIKPSEVRLLLACSRIHVDDRSRDEIRALLREGLDWTFVRTMAISHGVAPLVYRTLSTVAGASLPAALLAELRQYVHANTRRNLQRTSELLRLLERFRADGIDAMPFKGPILAETVYRSFALRVFSDLDILIRPRDLARATDALLSSGYRLNERTRTDGDAVECERLFLRGDGDDRVDVHWALTPAHFPVQWDHERLWSRAESIALAGSAVSTLDRIDLLVMLCVHGGKHAWERLQWVCDVAELVRASPELAWEIAEQRARAARAEKMLALGVVLAADLLDAPVPADVIARVRNVSGVQSLGGRIQDRLFNVQDVARDPDRDRLNQARLDRPWQVGRGLLYGQALRLQALDRLSDRARYALFFVRPTDRDKTFIHLPPSLAGLYYLLRPVRLSWDYGVRPLTHRFIRERRRRQVATDSGPND